MIELCLNFSPAPHFEFFKNFKVLNFRRVNLRRTGYNVQSTSCSRISNKWSFWPVLNKMAEWLFPDYLMGWMTITWLLYGPNDCFTARNGEFLSLLKTTLGIWSPRLKPQLSSRRLQFHTPKVTCLAFAPTQCSCTVTLVDGCGTGVW